MSGGQQKRYRYFLVRPRTVKHPEEGGTVHRTTSEKGHSPKCGSKEELLLVDDTFVNAVGGLELCQTCRRLS